MARPAPGWQISAAVRMLVPFLLEPRCMLALFRRFLNTWAARAFFIVLIASFGLWGISGTIRDLNRDTALAIVGDRKVEPAEFQEPFRKQLAQVSRMLGGRTEPTPAIRKAVAEQVLDRLIIQNAIGIEAKRLGVTVPNDALKEAVYDIPAFRGPAGTFNRTTFDTVLRQNNLTEPQFLDLMRSDLMQRQLMEAVQVGAAAPDTVTRQVWAFQRETRVADYVELAFAAAAAPSEPTEADLRRLYDNNLPAYSAPEFRRVKAVILSPDTVARDIEVPDADIAAYYESHRAEYVTPERRSVQVVVAQDEARAREIAASWAAGADWTAVQAAATAAGASSVAFDDATAAEFPAPELGQAVFAAAPNAVTGPLQSPLGWQVFRVTKASAGSERTLADVRTEIRDALAHGLAVDQVYARANKLEDALSASPSLDDLPGDLGLAAVTGTLDAQGNTPDGEPAPIPGSPALRQALLTAAFALAKGEPARMTEGPDQSYFAVAVEDATAPAPKPFADVQAQLHAEWDHDNRRREQEAVAARLLAAVKNGSTLDDAATVAGLRVQRTPPIGRSAPTPGVAQQLVEPLFALKPGEPTMVETPDAFLVAVPAEITAPQPDADPAGAAQIRTALTQALGQDIEVTVATALRDRIKPRVNRAILDSFIQ